MKRGCWFEPRAGLRDVKELQVHRALCFRKDYSDYEIYILCRSSSSESVYIVQYHSNLRP
jgi:hypothetical protein